MKNHEISVLFEQIADILELSGEDRFRINSYRKVARTLGDLTDDIEELWKQNRLDEVAGVGKSSAAKIVEYLTTGRMAFYEEVRAKVPQGLADLLRIQGLGPKTVSLLWKELGVTGLADFEAALDAGKVATLPGMGDKKIENFRRGLAEFRALQAAGAGRRVLLGVAFPVANDLARRLAALPGVKDAIPAGSMRRRKETIGDVDILVSAPGDAGPAVFAEFVKFPEVKTVLGSGTTKTSVLMRDGLQVDVRVVEPESFGAALQYFTGSKEHNVRLRELCIKKGWKLNEYGLFEGDKRIAGATEEEIYAKVGLAWIPPEMREDRGELAVAAAGAIPDLIELKDIRGDLHMHTTASDGRHTVEEMARAAMALGYKYIAITDHSQSLGVARGLDPDRLRAHIRSIREAEQKVGGIRIYAGTESDIKEDGSLDYDDELLGQLDIVIGSIHSHMRQSAADMTARFLKAIAHPKLTAVGHPTARYIDKRPPVAFDFAAVLDACVKHRVALEVNSSMERLDLSDVNCRAAVEAGVPLVIDTDAHAVEGLNQMVLGVATARRGWVKKTDVLNTLSAAAFEKRVVARN